MQRNAVDSFAQGAGRGAVGCGGGVAGIVLALALATLLVSTLVSTLDPLERDRRAAVYWRERELQTDLYQADLWAGYAWRLAPAAGATVLLTGLAVVLVLMVYRRWATYEMIRADRIIALERARNPALPSGLHSLTLAQRHAPAPALTVPGPIPDLLPPGQTDSPPVPTFGQLLDQGRLGRGQPMLLGYDDAGKPIEGSWLDLYSCGVGGLAGSGKSSTVAFLAAQAALFGTKIVILDPHASNPESLAHRLGPLAGRFLCAPAESPAEQLAAVELVTEELRRRTQGQRGEPLLFIADEYSALQRGSLAEPLARLVEALGQEGRKMQIYGLVAGQVWTASRSGGTEVRDSLASAFIHRCRPAQARYLTGLTAADLPDDLLDLPPGVAYLLSTQGELRRVRIPQVDPADLARIVAEAAPSPAATVPPPLRTPLGFRPVGASVVGTVGEPAEPLQPHQDALTLTAEERGIVAAFLSGESITDIAVRLAGGKKGGHAYSKATAIVAAALRKALGPSVAN